SARIRGRKAWAASMALVAVLLVAIGPPALPHGRDRSVSHVGLGMAGLGGGIAAGSPDMLIAIRGDFFRPKNRGCRPWGNSWVQPHLRRNSLKRLTRRRKHLRRGPALRRIHELVQLGENLPAGRGPKNFGCHSQTAAVFQIRFMRGRVLYLTTSALDRFTDSFRSPGCAQADIRADCRAPAK